MTLGFSTKWPDRMPDHLKNKPNLFIEKIWLSVPELKQKGKVIKDSEIKKYFGKSQIMTGAHEWYHEKHYEMFGKKWDQLEPIGIVEGSDDLPLGPEHVYPKLTPKKHTIRQDPKDRWKEGKLIHPVINNRTDNRFQFAPAFSCVSTQKIVIKHEDNGPGVWVDGQLLSVGMVEILAENDGFDNDDDFFAYFNTDFEGKIIHWTYLKY